jgi:uncharacterized protein (TIGR03437 family)
MVHAAIMKYFWLLTLVTVVITADVLPTARAQAVDSSTIEGKVLFGYQGWFRCPGGGTDGTNWSHWSNSGVPTATSIVVDMYPDMREFADGEGCQVPGMTVGDGSAPAYLYSAGNSRTVARHLKWMQEYGIDGLLLQRFINDIPGDVNSNEIVLRNVMAAAAQYGRVFAIEYDISGANPATLLATLQQDWNHLVNDLQITSAPGYLYENGKPVVSVWGIGMNGSSHPPNDVPDALNIVNWFHSINVTYMGGTPAFWRTNSNDAWPDPAWASFYQAMDIIQPWTVGRFGTLADADNWAANRISPDLAAAPSNKQLYMPVIFPGYSFYNANHAKRQNEIPRMGGAFLWEQGYNAWKAGAQMLKIAMFDEVNEATANFKLAAHRQDAPDQGFWLTLDADGFTLPSDWYLRLAGEITRGFHGQLLGKAMPTAPGPPWANVQGANSLTTVNAASYSGGPLAAETIATADGIGLAVPSQEAATIVDVIDNTGFGRPAPLLYASPTQINFEIPEGTATGTASLVIIAADKTASYGSITIDTVAPGLFSADGTGTSAAAGVAWLRHPDGSQSSSYLFNCSPAQGCSPIPLDLGGPGDVAWIELYGTGIRGRSSLNSVTCTFGGTTGQVSYVGAQGQFAGEDQVDVILPKSLAGTGQVNVKLTVDGKSANTVTVAFR